MQAVLLVGGKGTRLQTVVPHTPKPMVPLRGVPFLKYQLAWLANWGVDEVLLCTGYKAEYFHKHLSEIGFGEVTLTLSTESEPLDTGGALRNATPLIKEVCVVLNGDTFFDLNLHALVEFHKAHDALVTLALLHMDDISQRGKVEVDECGRVIRFAEKQGGKCAGIVNGGVYVLQREVLARIPSDRPVSIEYEVFPSLINEGRLFGMDVSGYFVDIGTPLGLAEAEAKLPNLFASRGWL